MTQLSYLHRSHLGDALFAEDDIVFRAAVVTADSTPDIAAFAAALSPLPAQHIPRIEDDDAIYGWPTENVRAKIERDGGDTRYGWRLREWPGVLLMASFHAVWVDPQATLIDITADVIEGDTSLFVPIPADAIPVATEPRYHITHRTPDTSADVAARIARMKTGQRAYEEKRASKAGQTLEEWLNDKFHRDKLQMLISTLIRACQDFDRKLHTLPDLVTASMAESEDTLAAITQNQTADAARSLVAPADVPIASADTDAASPEPDGAQPVEHDTATKTTAKEDDADRDPLGIESETAHAETWDAINKILDWSKPRELLQMVIAGFLQEG